MKVSQGLEKNLSHEQDDEEGEKTEKSKKYVPPKNVPSFDAGDTETLERNEEERNKKRSLSKSIMEDLRR